MNERKRRLAALAASVVFALAALPVDGLAAETEETRMLVPVGRAVGVKLFADGVMVVALSDGQESATGAKRAGVKVGDRLVTMNGESIGSTEQLQAMLAENGAAEATFGVRRGGRLVALSVTPEQGADGVYRLGAWIRDSMAGIGTVTWYDPATGAFAALGHGITDVDTGVLMPLASGAVMEASVKAVRRGESGAPGELRGDFDLERDLGTLSANTERGIFGVLSAPPEDCGEAVPVARRDEVREGAAEILANCSGDEVRSYAVEIERVYGGSASTRNFLLRVTDPALLALTGGIVQGMSGSPVLQDGKLVGAVTHVLVNDPTMGYGIFVENMLEAGE